MTERARETAGLTTRLIVRYVREQVGDDGVAALIERARIDATADELEDERSWWPYADKLALFHAAAVLLDDRDVGIHLGQEVLKQQVAGAVKLLLRALGSPGMVLQNVARACPKFTTVATMEALEVGHGAATIAYRVNDNFPPDRHDCGLNIGILSQVGPLFGLPPATVTHSECQLEGATRCVYRVTWTRRQRWWSRSKDASAQYHLDQLELLTGRFDALQHTAADLVSDDDLSTVLTRITERAAGAVLAPKAMLLLGSPDGRPEIVQDGFTPPEAERTAALVWAAPDASEAHRIVVDVTSAQRQYGYLAVFYEHHEFFAEDRALLASYARYAAAALDVATALDESRRRGETTAALLELAAALADLGEPRDVARILARSTPKVTGCDSAAVMLWDPEDEVMAVAGSHGFPEDVADAVEEFAVHASSAEWLRTLQENLEARWFETGPTLEAFRCAHLALYPIVARGELRGAIAARWGEGRDLGNEHALSERLAGLADQAGTALDNALLLERARHQALHDDLTGLANRQLFGDRLHQALQRSRRTGESVAVLYVDLDRFKKINDRLGHAVGNRILVEAANRLSSALRADDTVARLGGDEFALLLGDLEGPDEVEAAVDRILAAFRRPFDAHGSEIVVTASVGSASTPSGGTTDEALLRNADLAMYRAKELGRNHYVTYSAGLRPAAASLDLERDLHSAVEQDEFVLHYQPEIDLVTGRAVAVEALLRWQHPVRGLLGPDQFVPLAEETGLIATIDSWVLREACEQGRRWADDGLDDFRIAVNVSVRQLQRHDLPDLAARVLEETGLSGERLELEITETIALGDRDDVLDGLRRIGDLGVSVAIDDFGTGYSVLGRLRSLPVDKVKIDRSFVAELGEVADARALVSAIVAMAHGLGLVAVAEGVETVEQRDLLVAEGCDLAQGYLFARPMPAENLPAVLAVRHLPASLSA